MSVLYHISILRHHVVDLRRVDKAAANHLLSAVILGPPRNRREVTVYLAYLARFVI